jgi:hypothetical protein
VLVPAAFFAADSPLVGAWQLDSEQSARAALYLFTPRRYSMVLAATDRRDIADTSKATADELRDPHVAKSPVVMKSGANEGYQFQIERQDADAQAGAERARRCRRLSANVEVRSR